MKQRLFLTVLLALQVFQPDHHGAEARTGAKQRPISPEKELLITDVRVVDSPLATYPGPFSFGRLMEKLPAPGTAPAMVRKWLYSWLGEQSVNGVPVPPRIGMRDQIILPWQAKDGYDAGSKKEWEPNLANAPFRLLAIVNRLDLAGLQLMLTMQRAEDAKDNEERSKWEELLYGRAAKQRPQPLPRDILAVLPPANLSGPTTGWSPAPASTPLLAAAEGRFVFCAVAPDGEPLAGGFTVILEYPLATRPGFPTVREWARAWHDLGRFPDFNSDYLTALQDLTANFTTAPGFPDKLTIIRIRTSEKSFGLAREMREFSHPVNNEIALSTLAQTPRAPFAAVGSRENELLGQFLASQGKEVASAARPFPGSFRLRVTNKERREAAEAKNGSAPGADSVLPVVGGSCELPEQSPGFCWKFKEMRDDKLRHDFSLQTCNGCHCGETNTPDGLHIKPRRLGVAAEVSAFLKPGRLVVPDPSGGGKLSYGELQDRMAIMEALLEEKVRKRDRALLEIARDRSRRAH